MLNNITKEEFDIYNYVSDNLEEYINNKKLLKKNNDDYNNIFLQYFICIFYNFFFNFHILY